MFHKINMEKWPRKEWFVHYTKEVPCTFSTVSLIDITHIKKKGYGVYPALLWALSATVNKFEEFRTCKDKDGNLGYYDMLWPSYTVFNEERKTFSVTCTEYDVDFGVFFNRYKADSAAAKKAGTFYAKPLTDNVFSVSMDPWTRFTGFNLNLSEGGDYFLPIFTAGRYEEQNGRITLPLAVQVHHAVCDGYHAGAFLRALQETLDAM